MWEGDKMNKDREVRIYTALMGKGRKWEWIDGHGYGWVGTELEADWSPSTSSGRMIEEVIDFWIKELPEEWEKYLQRTWIACLNNKYADFVCTMLSLPNLTAFIEANWEAMFMVECPDKDFGDWGYCGTDAREDCPIEGGCNGTGRIIPDKWRAVVEVLKEGRE